MRSRLLLIVLAAALAITSALAVVLLIGNAEQRVLSRFEAETAFVASKPIPVGTSLQDALDNDLIKTEQFPSQALPASRMRELPVVPGELYSTANIAAGQIILETSFGAEIPESARVSIPPGLMATSVELSVPARVGDFITPGAEVAVFVSFPVQGEGTTSFTDLLISRAKVLAVGPVTVESADSAQQSEIPSSVITLALSQQDAQRLIFVTNSGGLVNLALLTSSSELNENLLITPENAFN